MAIKLIVGLANPGTKYNETRHNMGAWYIEQLAKYYCQSLKLENRFYGYTGQLTIGNHDVRLLVPTTSMNLSGKAVAAMASFYHFTPGEILVAHDELDLLPGNARLKIGGSHCGHNGLKNIIYHLDNNTNFYRLRIGIGYSGDKNKIVSFVLGKPPTAEQQLIKSVINEAVHCTVILIIRDSIHAMNRLHAYKPG